MIPISFTAVQLSPSHFNMMRSLSLGEGEQEDQHRYGLTPLLIELLQISKV